MRSIVFAAGADYPEGRLTLPSGNTCIYTINYDYTCILIAVLAPSTMRAILGNGASVQVF